MLWLWAHRWTILRALGTITLIAVMVTPFALFVRLMVNEGPWWWAAAWIPVAGFLTLGALEYVFSRAGTHKSG